MITLFDKPKAFWQDEAGVAMVEFAIILPIMFLIIGFVIEGSRIMWSFQSAISGVRDASRYLAKVAPLDTCITGTTSQAQFNTNHKTTLTTIVTTSLGVSNQLLPGGVTLNPDVNDGMVAASYKCVGSEGDYRIPKVTIAEATANIRITLPFSGFFELVGDGYGDIDVAISDEHRVIGQ